MITVELAFKDEHLIAYEISGHAMARNSDQEFDLVCAAVSILAITITNGITDVLQISPRELAVSDGKLFCKLPEDLSSPVRQQADALLDTLVLGLEQVAADYRKHIQIVRRRCTS